MFRFTAPAASSLYLLSVRLCDTDTATRAETFGFAYSDTELSVVQRLLAVCMAGS
jgi:hypothetical protein